TATQTTTQAHNGTHSLQINITNPNGWGVQLNNHPYYPTHPGAKVIKYWAKTTNAVGIAVTMQVIWRDNGGNVLQTDNVTIPSLTKSWQQGLMLTSAPIGSAYMAVNFLNSTGVNGNKLFLDDIVVADNALDAGSADLEGSSSHWVPGTASAVTTSTAEAHSGTHSLQIGITGARGWSVLNDYPYYPETPGAKILSFWGKAGTGTGATATLQATWRDAYGNVLQTDNISSAKLTTTWKQTQGTVTAPPGTESVGFSLRSTTSKAGTSIYLDDLTVLNGGP
ncbi:MAG: hypothetical protein QOE57_638, partial [Acidimicrobiaceae bacterium]|nr:hypothetical protein [Acidimicrobiaceae bacterium]